MAQSRTDGNLYIPPLQLALALTILKSKPFEYSTREYIDKLRQQRRSGERNVNHGTAHQYLDAVAHWKGRFKDSQIEILDLQRRLVRLEHEIEMLKCTGGIVGAPEPSNVSRSSRKRASREESDAPSKRTRLSIASITPNGHLYKALEEDFEALGTSDYGTAAVHHIWQAHKSYRQLYSDPSILAYHLSKTSYNITRHVATVLKNCREQQFDALSKNDRRLRDMIFSNVDKELQKTQRVAGRTFASLLHGLTTLDGASDGAINRRQGAVIYSYVQSFDTLLSVMSTTISLITLHTKSDAQSSKISETNARKVKPRSFESVPSSLATLLLAIISSLDPKQKSHRALFEGIMYLLLERVGNHLYVLTFNKDRGATMEEDIEMPSLPGSAHKDDGESKGTLKQRDVTTEAKYLTQLLERAMSLAPSCLGSTLPASTNSKSVRPTSAVTKPNVGQTKSLLTSHEKEKLQHTLIYAMFGDDYAQNEFVERLKKPVAVGPVPVPPKIEDEEIPQWFREKIWRLVGWDILTREGW